MAPSFTTVNGRRSAKTRPLCMLSLMSMAGIWHAMYYIISTTGRLNNIGHGFVLQELTTVYYKIGDRSVHQYPRGVTYKSELFYGVLKHSSNGRNSLPMCGCLSAKTTISLTKHFRSVLTLSDKSWKHHCHTQFPGQIRIDGQMHGRPQDCSAFRVSLTDTREIYLCCNSCGIGVSPLEASTGRTS